MLGSTLFLLLNQDRVKEVVSFEDLLEESKGKSCEEIIEEFYKQCMKCRTPKMPVLNSHNFVIKARHPDGDIRNLSEYFAKVQRGFKLSTLEKPDAPPMAKEVFSQILDILVCEDSERRIKESKGQDMLQEFWIHILYKVAGSLGLISFNNADAGVEESFVSCENLNQKLAFLRNEEVKSKIVEYFCNNPLKNMLSYQLIHLVFGEQEVSLTESITTEEILTLFSRYLQHSLETMGDEEVLNNAAFNYSITGSFEFKKYYWAPHITLGYCNITHPFIQERAGMSSDYFVPESEYYSIQKTKVTKLIKIEGEEKLKADNRQEPTPFDQVEYPSMQTFISKLSDDNLYVTDDFDWKCVIFDFKEDTFRCLQYKEKADQIPFGLSDYAYFFGSRHLGWARATTLNVLICTEKKLRYLNCLMKNINLFVAPNEKTPLKYLVEYIFRSINVKLTESGSEEAEMDDILKHLRFGTKFSEMRTWKKETDMDITLAELRDKINPEFSKESRQVDFICYFRHPKNPQLVSYRSAQKRAIGEKVDIKPEYRTVEYMKCSTNSVLAYFHRWILGPRIETVFKRPMIDGVSINMLLPAFLLLDVSVMGNLLFNPVQHLDFEYIEYLLKDVEYSTCTKYKLRGLLCQRPGGRYFPISIRVNFVGCKSFEGSKPENVEVYNIPDSIVKYILLERENSAA